MPPCPADVAAPLPARRERGRFLPGHVPGHSIKHLRAVAIAITGAGIDPSGAGSAYIDET
jgi:hypothetical protein